MDKNNTGGSSRAGKKITMKDIAAHLNIDRTTVSKAMSDNPGLSEEMVRRVKQAAEELGYRKDIFASGLTTGKNSLFGLVMADMNRSIYAPLVAGFQRAARKRNYGVILQIAGPRYDDVERAIDLLKQQRVSGATFIADSTNKTHNELLIELVRSGMAVNTTRKDAIYERIDHITFDHRKAAYEATFELIGLGHTHIAFAFGCFAGGTPQARLEGYLKAMNEAGLPPRMVPTEEQPARLGGDQVRQTYRFARQFWRQGERPTAFIGSNDCVALGILHAMKDEGVAIPEEVSIVGFDDWQAVLAVPPITSSRIPLGEAGELAVEQLLERLKEPDKPSSTTVLDCELIRRESTAPPPRKS